MSARTILFSAAAIADAEGLSVAPGFLLARLGSEANVLAFGPREEVESHPAARSAQRVDLRDSVLIPGLVNAHTHLDLTHIGPQRFEPIGGFTGWAERIRVLRAASANAIASSVREGIERSLRGGVVALGDIAGAGQTIPLQVLRSSALRGVSFIEVFGMGARQTGAVQFMKAIVHEDERSIVSRASPVRLGLQPHAPYSAGIDVYRAAINLHDEFEIPLATHLAESPEEREFITRGTGPLRDLLTRLNVWDDSILTSVAHGKSPIRYLETILKSAPMLAVHVLDCSDDDMEMLAESRVTVVYCPRAARYFGHESNSTGHRYLEMIRRGIPVALGTDSIICLPENECDRLSTLDEMRFLFNRDGAPPKLLLSLATTSGAKSLGISPDLFRFHDGELAGLVAIKTGPISSGGDPLRAVLESRGSPRLLWPEHSFK